MSKDTFWALIQEAKAACGQDMGAMEDCLRDRLVSMGPAASKDFHDFLHAYEDLADQYGLWDAASVIKEYGCSDDGFIDFRAWLIVQGKDIYMNALKDPDTLADVEPYGGCCFECLSYDLPQFLPRLCEKYGGPERFQVAPSTWNFDLHEIRWLLNEGKARDQAVQRKEGSGVR